MSYRQRSSYQDTSVRRASGWRHKRRSARKNFDIQSHSPLDSIRDPFGYIGFTSLDS